MMDLPQFPLDRLRSVWLTRAPALAIGACLFAFGPGVLAQADSRMPPRKPGLWETSTSSADRAAPGMSFQQCVDAKSEENSKNQFSRDPNLQCSTSNVRTGAGTYEADYMCDGPAGKTSGHIKMSGDRSTRYTMTNTMRRDPPPASGPAEQTVIVTAVYKGDCPPGMSPGQSSMAGVPLPKAGEKMSREQIEKMMEQFKRSSSGN